MISSRIFTAIALALCVVGLNDAAAQSKAIRLRSGSVSTPPRAAWAGSDAKAREPVNGLFLVQFEGALEEGGRSQLQQLGVELLAYVPDDAFVARLRGIRPADLAALPFVRWLDRYRADQRLHGNLLGAARGRGPQGPDDQLGVRVLLAADADRAELAHVRTLFNEMSEETRCRLGVIASARIRSGRILEAATSTAVLWMEPAGQPQLAEENASALIGGPATNHLTFTQALGYNGAGVTVAIADSGLDRGTLINHTELLGRTKALLFYGGLPNAADEHMHGTHVAGIIAGSGVTLEGDQLGFHGLGVSPGVQLVVQRIFDARGGFRPPSSMRILAEDAVQHGATIGNNSWADDTQGRYDLSAALFDELTRDANATAAGEQPLLFVFSAGNAGPGPQSIGSPAVSKNVIAVGASQGPRTNFLTHGDGPSALAVFSSRGPCEDGRIKPDLVGPGTWIASLLSRSGRVENAWAPINDEFAFGGGTSQAAPHVTGAAAVFVQYYRSHYGTTPSPALVKAALINAADDLTGLTLSASVPNMDEGWGRANAATLVRSVRKHEFVEQSTALAQSEIYERLIFITETNLALKITLAYTDCPGFPAAVPALVNNLDLELKGPDGRAYFGNQFASGESIPDARIRDALNNVEGIHLARPARGIYRMRVRARNIAQDACREIVGVNQDFAVVISGGTPGPGEGVILADRAAYRAPDRIGITLRDGDLSGRPTAMVTVRSRSETNGILVTLQASVASGTFTGAVLTAAAPGNATDTLLHIEHDDWIRLEYTDASHQITRVTTAIADLVPPVLSSVSVKNQFGQHAILWTTDEPAVSLVRYGTQAGVLSQVVSNTALATAHTIELVSLTPDLTYYYAVTAIDAAGNAATENTGASFVPTMNATVLLVDAYQADPLDAPIPLDSYTTPLTEIGFTHDVWSLNELQTLPSFTDLRPYSIVIWRINDSYRRPNDSIPAEQQEAIRAYLDAGGSFFLASMNVLSRLLNQGSTAFVTNVLRVQRFVLNPNPFEHCLNCDEDFQVPNAIGVRGDIIGRGLSLTLDYSSYPTDGILGPDFSDTFTPSTNASPVLVEFASGKTCALRYPRTGQDSPGRIVFLAFPLEAIPASGLSPNTRRDFLRRALQFLSPGVGGAGSLALHQERFTVPDLITVEMADSDLERSGSAAAQVYSDSHPNPISVPLSETSRPGLFRGLIPVADPTAPVVPGAVLAVDGDQIHVVYQDVSSGLPVEATAVVDSSPPQLSDISIQVGFHEATITWTTSEPTDALVQFGESAFLGQTEYQREPRTAHALRLTGLIPGRSYYFKLTARDEAGNLTTTTDGGGALGTFQTLPPLRPPYIDDVERVEMGTNWSVISLDDSQRAWSVGSPNDGHTARAYSGLSAWASNLYGEPADIIDTYLISPAIDLRNLNVATLRFQHDYDFLVRTDFDLISRGRLLISTNVQTDPLPLAEYRDFIFDWEEVEIDLTPFTGRVIFLVWHHQLRSASPEPPLERPGWVLDDIEITASSVPGGTIRIVNNISQARFSVGRGGLILSGQGTVTAFTNLPPGTYVTTFDPVEFYTTPAPITNTLASAALLDVSGVYRFIDVNTNGMSDAWELARFGVVDPLRTMASDTDADGFPDYAEFIAGTSPTAPNSHLAVSEPFPLGDGQLRFSWPSAPGRTYQLQATDAANPWVPASVWIRAVSDVVSVILPSPGPTDPLIYRVEVRP